MIELSPVTSSVHISGLIKFRIDALKRGKVKYHISTAHASPDTHKNQRWFCPEHTTKPVWTVDADIGKQNVQKSKVGIVNPAPQPQQPDSRADAREEVERAVNDDAAQTSVHHGSEEKTGRH